MKERQLQIKQQLLELGTKTNEKYTNEEILDKLVTFQKEISTILFEKTYAKNLSDRDVMLHIDTMAAEYGMEKTMVYKRLRQNMEQLHYMIWSYIRGMKGENICKKGLKLLSYEKDVEIMFNLAVDDGEANTEYDALVITCYGLFIIEVKNWSGDLIIDSNGFLRKSDCDVSYDLPGKLGIKEALIKQYIQDIADVAVRSILMIPKLKSLTDRYNKIDVCIGMGISHKIKNYDGKTATLTAEEVKKIANVLREHAVISKGLCDIDCETIAEDFSEFITEIEERANERKQLQENKEMDDIIPENISWRKWLKRISFAGMFATIGTGALYAWKKSKQK